MLWAIGPPAVLIHQAVGYEPMTTNSRAGRVRVALATAACLLFAGFSRADDSDLTGKWSDDGGNYAIRQVGDQVWWVSRCKDDGGKTWTSVFHGKLTGRQLTGHFADVPEGDNRFRGSLTAKLIVREGVVVEIKGEQFFSPSNDRKPWSIRPVQ